MAGVQITLAPEFGCVVFDVIISWFVLMWMVVRVARARKEYDVKYPAVYSDKHVQFNCIQRVHQNTLEVYPQWLIFLILGGLQHPSVSAVAGLVWIVSRVFYALGYYTGNPKNRSWGSFGYIALFAQMGCTISFALHLVGYL